MKTRLAALMAFVALAAIGCSDDSTSSDSGKLTVKLADTPFPFGQVSSVDVFVVRVDARQASVTDAEAEAASNMSGWVTIASPNESFNLLSLQGGVTANLGTSSLESGTYNSFRLIIDPAQSSVTLNDGSHPSVQWPSAAQTGIKIKLDNAIVIEKDSSVMILDFDVGRSFVMRGNNISQNGLLFKPTIKAVASEATGSVSGTVHALLPTGAVVAGATVEILTAGSLITDTDPDHVVATTVTDASGNFTVNFLMPGTYVVRVTPLTTTGYIAALLTGGLTITSGASVTGKVIVVGP